jgi:hypothetical protein
MSVRGIWPAMGPRPLQQGWLRGMLVGYAAGVGLCASIAVILAAYNWCTHGPKRAGVDSGQFLASNTAPAQDVATPIAKARAVRPSRSETQVEKEKERIVPPRIEESPPVDLRQPLSGPGSELDGALRAFAAAKREKLPVLLILHKAAQTSDVLREWERTVAGRGLVRSLLLDALARCYAVIALPIDELPALSRRLGVSQYAAPDQGSPLFVITRSNARQLAAVTTWDKTDDLAYAVAQGIIQEAKEHDRSDSQLRTLLAAVEPIDAGLSNQVRKLLSESSRRSGPGPLAPGGSLVLPPVMSAGPEIFSITPESGPAGIPVRITGKGLATTGRVVFAIDRALSRARFKVISDEEIEVLVPECYRPGAAATVAVFTESGAAVAMPATVQTVRSSVRGANVAEAGETFYHVQSGGAVSSAESVAVIEKGGVVAHSTNAAMHFVKSGGTLLEFRNRAGIVFYEPGAQLGPGVARPNQRAEVTLVRVPEITECPGVGPFRYVAPPRPDLSEARAVPPLIKGR